MEGLLNMFHRSGPLGLVEAGMCPVGALLVLGVVGLLVSGRRCPPVIALGILTVPMGLGIVGVWAGERMVFDAVARASAETKQAMMAAGLSQSMYLKMISGAVAASLAGLTIAGCAVSGVMRGPRAGGTPAVAAVLTLVIVGLTVFGGVQSHNLMGGLLRGGLYLAVGLGVSISLLNAEKGSPGSLAGATAAMAFPVLITGAELYSLGNSEVMAFEAVAVASAETKVEMLQAGLALVAAQRTFSFASVGIALILAALGAVRNMEGTLRDVGIAGALLYCLVAPYWLSTDASDSFEQLMAGFTYSDREH